MTVEEVLEREAHMFDAGVELVESSVMHHAVVVIYEASTSGRWRQRRLAVATRVGCGWRIATSNILDSWEVSS